MKWSSAIYIGGMLPIGLRSAQQLADGLEWCIAREGVEHVFHYLDVLGTPESDACQLYLKLLKETCQELSVPLAPVKQDGPSTVITFLGITIDAIRQELRLPEDKLRRLSETVSQWESHKACTQKDLESLTGTLHHACKVILPGRSFLRQAISLLSVTKRCHHHIRLNKEFRSDIAWWRAFAASWNGASLVIHSQSMEFTITSDASGAWECGVWHGSVWFHMAWDGKTRDMNIAAKELIPIIVAAVIWGQN